MPAIPRISPLYAVKEASFNTFKPSLFRHVTPRISIRFFAFSGSVRLISSVTFSPTIISVRDSTVAPFVSTVSMYFPFRSTATRSESSNTSFNLCVMMMMDFPAARMLRNTANNFSVSCGVKTAVGSSKIRISAPRYKTFTISTVCFWETDIS